MISAEEYIEEFVLLFFSFGGLQASLIAEGWFESSGSMFHEACYLMMFSPSLLAPLFTCIFIKQLPRVHGPQVHGQGRMGCDCAGNPACFVGYLLVFN